MGAFSDDDVRAAKRRRVGEKSLQPGTCAVCGCTEDNPCRSRFDGVVCGWSDASRTLCTACKFNATRNKRHLMFPRKIG